jgi:CheY-like chemotaxis protein
LARKILLADDSVTAQNMGRKILTDAGYDVSTVNNGSAALKKIAEQKPDLIVLDVYMPGYSGLEVCQRIKEARETARIPVLLTVGKLEPFKPEEARRARADGFIIKPFEASELLVALTKLEDKIVPQPEPYKPGRFAKAIAAVEQLKNGETGEDFGDAESGWKNRIQFPSATPKAPEPEPEIEIPPAGKKGFRDFFRSERKQRKAEPEFDRPLPAGVPPDITSEEIAAIAAAAAKVSSASQATEPVPVPAQISQVEAKVEAPAETKAPEPPSEPVPAVAASTAPATVDEAPPVTFASATQVPDEKFEISEIKTGAEPSAPVVSAQPSQTTPPAQPEIPVPAIAKVPEPDPSDAEVMAALQSLDRQDTPAVAPKATEEFVTASAAKEVAVPASTVAIPMRSGPHWIAELVAVSPEESALRLEEEMEKAHAAAAGAGLATFAAFSSGTPAAQSDRPKETAMSAMVQEHVASTGPASIPPSEAVTTAQAEPETTPVPVAQVEAATDVKAVKAESLAVPAPVSEIAALEPDDQKPGPAPVEASIDATEPAALTQESVAEPAIPVSAATSFPQEEAQAPAPAAVDSSAPETAPTAIAGDQPSAQSNATTRPSPEADQDVAKTAAAWASWHQVHETIPEQKVATASSAEKDPEIPQGSDAASASSVEKEALAAAAAAAAGSDSSVSSSDTAIASIVEGVLAELRPKLVEEIAKKLKK